MMWSLRSSTKSFGSRAMSMFEEPSSGFAQDWNSFCSNWYLCEIPSPDPASHPCVPACLCHLLCSQHQPCPLVRPIPQGQRAALEPPSFSVWHKGPGTEAPSGHAVLHQVQPGPPMQGMLLGKAIPGAEIKPSFVPEGYRHHDPPWKRHTSTSWPEA